MNQLRIDTAQLLTPAVRKVMEALAGGGGTARLVGGCVRDSLLGRPPGDADIAVDLEPVQAKQLLEEAGFKVLTIGIRFGTVVACPPRGAAIEVTSLRRDVRTDGRFPVVEFGGDWVEDARRRDFTMNALYADADGTVHDPLGGIADLHARRLRFIGDPARRIREDFLRILRFFRFHAWYGTGEPDAAGLAACQAEREGIARLTVERIWMELRRLLGAPDPAVALRAAHETGVLDAVLGAVQVEDLDALTALCALEQAQGLEPDWMRRWLLLERSVVEDSGAHQALSGAEWAGRTARDQALGSGESALALGYHYGAEAATDAILVRGARTGCAEVTAALEAARRGAAAELPLKAADLLKAGVPKGPKVGKGLRRAARIWLDGDLAPTREALLRAACDELRP